MTRSQTKITYLFHSGFAVETVNCFLLFDYYQPLSGKQKNISDGIISLEMLQKQPKHIYVFSSHNHADHFDPVILKWAELPLIKYILSDDIRVKTPPAQCHFLASYERFCDAHISVQSFGSTDIGISFLVLVDGLSLFHAGDLNWWQWKEDTPNNQANAVAAFQAEIAKIVGHPIDIAFFPVDRRLEEHYAQGATYFAAQLHPKLLIPMHFGKDFDATAAFASQFKESGVPTVEITRQGQQIWF